MPDPLELLALHGATLDVLNENGDMLVTNEPFVPGRRRAVRFRAAWNRSGIHICFRDDIEANVRVQAENWASRFDVSSPPEHHTLEQIGKIFGEPADRVNLGPAYWADEPCSLAGNTVEITPENAHLLPEGFLDDGEIDYIKPSFAVVQEGQAVSTCLTVRRGPRSIEAGTDTLEAYRGRGYAVQATCA
jgi:hypothetical protein